MDGSRKRRGENRRPAIGKLHPFWDPLILIVSGWLYYRKGVWAASAGAGLIALSPTILAHVSLATTDACLAVCVTGTLCLMSRYLQRPSRWKLFWLSIAIGAAIASKYSALFLLPVLGLLLLLRGTAKSAGQNARSWRTQIAAFVAVPILIFVSCWALHGFGSVRLNRINLIGMPKDTFGVELFGQTPLAQKIDSLKVPSPIAGIAFQYLHNLQGHPAFLMGERSDHGWWYFLPCAFAFKSTPVELLLAAILIFTLAASIPRLVNALRSLDVDLQTLVVGAITFLLLIMMSRVNMAQRYLLPLYPLLIILGVDRIWHALGSNPKWQIGTTVAFIGLQLSSSLSIAPHYLSYFNRFSGGPEQGWHLLVDSNVDWGQDLPALRDKLTTLSNKRIALAYFGTARPLAYNINADSIFESTPSGKYDILAVSVTFLQGLYLKMPSIFQNFISMKPLDKAGYSIFLFDLSTPEGEAAFADALKRIEAGSKADPQLAASKTEVDLYQFTMTLLAAQDYPDKDVFDLCYSQLFQDRSAAPAKLAFIQNKLDSVSGSGYRLDFKLGLLHAAKLILLPGAASVSRMASPARTTTNSGMNTISQSALFQKQQKSARQSQIS